MMHDDAPFTNLGRSCVSGGSSDWELAERLLLFLLMFRKSRRGRRHVSHAWSWWWNGFTAGRRSQKETHETRRNATSLIAEASL